MTIEMTTANRGRSMKTLDNLSWTHPLNAFGNDELIRREPLADHNVHPARDIGLDASDLNLVVLVDDEDVRTGLIDLQRLLRHQQRALALALFGHDGDQLSVNQHAVGIGEHRSHLDRVSPLIHRIVEEVDFSGAGIAAAVRELDVDDILAALTRGLLLAYVEHLALRDREAGVDRVLTDDGGQRAIRRADEVADRHR